MDSLAQRKYNLHLINLELWVNKTVNSQIDWNLTYCKYDIHRKYSTPLVRVGSKSFVRKI